MKVTLTRKPAVQNDGWLSNRWALLSHPSRVSCRKGEFHHREYRQSEWCSEYRRTHYG